MTGLPFQKCDFFHLKGRALVHAEWQLGQSRMAGKCSAQNAVVWLSVDVGLAGEAISATNVYRTLAAKTALATLRGSATVSKDGADFTVTKVLL